VKRLSGEEVNNDTSEYFNANTERKQSEKVKSQITSEYSDIFDGVGCFEGECTINLDPNVQPYVCPPRRVPVALQEPLKQELSKLVSEGIIAPLAVDEPSDWCNNVVCVTKADGGIRLCLDPAKLNEAIIRPYHYTPTLEDVLPKLSGAKYFSIVDARSGYWNIKLDRKSSYYTTFLTPFGRFRFLRLPFGLSCSSDMFQKKIDETYHDMNFVTGIADDLVIMGYDDEDHDRNMKQFLDRTREKGIKLNPEKCIFKCTKIPFFGMVTGENGLEPDPKKVQAILDMKRPENKKDLQSYLGMVNYLARFSPYIAELSIPLRDLLKKDVPFIWTFHHQKAFNALKAELSSPKILRYFDSQKPVVLEVDASGYGLGAALLQLGECVVNDDLVTDTENLQPVAYASKGLSEAEQRYANIEREMLAVLFGLEISSLHIW